MATISINVPTNGSAARGPALDNVDAAVAVIQDAVTAEEEVTQDMLDDVTAALAGMVVDGIVVLADTSITKNEARVALREALRFLGSDATLPGA